MPAAKTETTTDSGTHAIDALTRAAAPAINEGKRQFGVLLDSGSEFLDSVSGRITDTASDLGKNVLDYTKKNPMTALLLAVGAGVLLFSAAKSIQSRR
jgi:hypothetical protein